MGSTAAEKKNRSTAASNSENRHSTIMPPWNSITMCTCSSTQKRINAVAFGTMMAGALSVQHDERPQLDAGSCATL